MRALLIAPCILKLLLQAGPLLGQEPRVVFLEHVGADAPADSQPIYQVVDDPQRLENYRSWLDNDSARWALDLYEQALEVARAGSMNADQPDALHIALVPGGNHADIGFRLLRTNGPLEAHPRVAYIKLAPDDWRFGNTLLHEMGHVVLSVLNGGQPIPARSIAAISHSTSALTDRGTAFDEGYAIHLETLVAHISEDTVVREKYRHEQMLFGTWPGYLAEYYRSAADLLTFSQTVARYSEVRDNSFAFESAFKGPDYLRVQLEKARDFATLRNPNQLLQSEGFYATFFFALLMRGKSLPDREELRARQRGILEVIAQAVRAEPLDPETPHMLRILDGYREIDPEAWTEALDVFLDLSHGAFVDPEALALWRKFYLASLRLDLEALDRERLEATRMRWREAARDPERLRARLGPQVRCVVQGEDVHMPALGDPVPLSFDANTVQEGVLRLVPGLGEAGIERWLNERERTPFVDGSDLSRRVGFDTAVASSMLCTD